MCPREVATRNNSALPAQNLEAGQRVNRFMHRPCFCFMVSTDPTAHCVASHANSQATTAPVFFGTKRAMSGHKWLTRSMESCVTHASLHMLESQSLTQKLHSQEVYFRHLQNFMYRCTTPASQQF